MWKNQVFKNLKKQLFDLILPIKCLSCQKTGTWLCQNCFEKIPLTSGFYCPNCQNLSLYGQTHLKCQRKTPLSGLIIATNYNNTTVKKAIHLLKYKKVKNLSVSLAQLFIKTLILSPFHLNLFKNNFYLVSIPLFKRKLADRGFNQSQLLAEIISSRFNWPFLDALEKIKPTKSQVDLKDFRERKENVKNTFKTKNSVRGRNIILVDDVITTGATVKEAAKTLKGAGALKIWALVLAKG